MQSLRIGDKGMDINPQDEPSYTTQYQRPFLEDVVNDYYTRLRGVPVNKLDGFPNINYVPSVMGSGSC
jgi:hypothetical protein